MSTGVDQLVPSKVLAKPEPSTTAQKLELGQESAVGPAMEPPDPQGSRTGVDQVDPFQ
jgi:hypothetical protein